MYTTAYFAPCDTAAFSHSFCFADCLLEPYLNSIQRTLWLPLGTMRIMSATPATTPSALSLTASLVSLLPPFGTAKKRDAKSGCSASNHALHSDWSSCSPCPLSMVETLEVLNPPNPKLIALPP